MPNLVLVCGPQASGKTTWINDFLKKNHGYELISSDLFWPRREDTGKRYWWNKDGEEFDWGTAPIDQEILAKAYRWARYKLMEALEGKKDVVYEGTFTTKKDRKKFLQDPKEAGYKVHGVFFYPTLLECAQRNEKRHDRVPDIVLARTYAQIQVPTEKEGFQKLEII